MLVFAVLATPSHVMLVFAASAAAPETPRPLIFMPRSTTQIEAIEPEVHDAGACAPQRGRSSARATFWLAPTVHVLQHALKRLDLSVPPVPWNGTLPEPLSQLPPGTVQNTHHGRFQEVLVRKLALHPACTNSSAQAKLCIIVSPPTGHCHDWASICPGRTLAVISFFDPDLVFYHGFPNYCRTLWGCESSTGVCGRQQTCPPPRLLRIVANPPHLVQRFACGFAPSGTISIPYLAHARSAAGAIARLGGTARGDTADNAAHGPAGGGVWHASAPAVLVALAAGRFSHKSMRAFGFTAWREQLVAACRQRAQRDNTTCHDLYPTPNGGNALQAVHWYARARFCLQPPGAPRH